MPAKSTGGAKGKTAKKAAKKTTKKKAAESAKKKTRAKSTIKKAAKAKSTQRATKAAPKVRAAAVKQPAAATKRAAPPPQKADVARVRVRQIRSSIGRRRDFRETLRALGIRHHQGEVVVTRNPAIDGMLAKVSHLIRVTPEE